MLSKRFLDSGMWVVGGGLLVAVAGAVVALAPHGDCAVVLNVRRG